MAFPVQIGVIRRLSDVFDVLFTLNEPLSLLTSAIQADKSIFLFIYRNPDFRVCVLQRILTYCVENFAGIGESRGESTVSSRFV